MISLVVAMDQNRLIGDSTQNTLPWVIDGKNRYPDDMQHFKRLTWGGTVVMGRKTFDSIPTEGLPNRLNVVITRKPKIFSQNQDVWYYHDVNLFLRDHKNIYDREIFVSGGLQIFQTFLDRGLVDRIYLSHLHGQHLGDLYFPEVTGFKTIETKTFPNNTIHIETLERI